MIQYTKILENKPVIEDQGLHFCEELDEANKLREENGEMRVYIFQDFENQEFNLGVGLEFIPVKFCPLCGRKVSEDSTTSGG